MSLSTLSRATRNPDIQTRAQRRAPRYGLAAFGTVTRRAALVSSMTLSACSGIDMSSLSGVKYPDATVDLDASDVDLPDFVLPSDAGGNEDLFHEENPRDASNNPDAKDAFTAPVDGTMTDAKLPDIALTDAEKPTDVPLLNDVPAPGDLPVLSDGPLLTDVPLESDMPVLADAHPTEDLPGREDIGPTPDVGIQPDAALPPVPCAVGIGPCRTAGFIGPDGECNAMPLPPHEERCNNLDDDCDGTVDNNIARENCSTACGDGQYVCEAGGQRRCDAVQPVAENAAALCNGEDDDCNGQIDDGLLCHEGDECSEGDGECRRQGIIVGGRCNVVAGQPQREICNNLDDDCDRIVDNGVVHVAGQPDFTGSSEPCSTACEDGIRLCREGVLEECSARLPQAEICDGINNDCDNQTDEGCGLGSACSVGVGECARQGTIVLNQGHPGTHCSAVAGQPGQELCNALDDDCDGQTDESFPESGDGCNVGIGACENQGTTTCVNGALSCNVVAGSPTPELCNTIDDDCDGQVDEGVCGQVGSPCHVGEGICRVNGVVAADRSCNLEGKVALEAKTEICNQLDDDCNGSTDENGVCAEGLICSNGLGDCRMEATLEIRDGELVCPAVPGQWSFEVCNGRPNDENCDGQANEGCQ